MASPASLHSAVRRAVCKPSPALVHQHRAFPRLGQVRTAVVTNFPFWAPRPRILVKVPMLDPILYHGSPLPTHPTIAAAEGAGASGSILNQTSPTLSPPFSSAHPSLEALWYSNLAHSIAAPFHAYARAQTRRPYVVQVLTTLVIYFLGDLSAQYFTRPRTPEQLAKIKPDHALESHSQEPTLTEYYEPKRAVRSLIIGGISAIPNFHWHVYLSHAFNIGNSHIASLAVKILVQQFVHTPILNSYFFFMQAFLAPLPPSSPAHADKMGSSPNLMEKAKAKIHAGQQRVISALPTSWINSFMFWPIVTAINFKFVPVGMRSVFGGAAAIGWNSYLLVLNQRSVESGS